MAAKKSSGGGGIKGFLTRAGSSFYAGGMYAKEKGMWLAQKAGRIGFIIATTSIVTLMPLIFEITREGQVRAGCLRLRQRFASMIQYICMFVCNFCRCLDRFFISSLTCSFRVVISVDSIRFDSTRLLFWCVLIGCPVR